MIAIICCKPGFEKNILLVSDSRKILPDLLKLWNQQIVFLPLAKSFGSDNNLMFLI